MDEGEGGVGGHWQQPEEEKGAYWWVLEDQFEGEKGACW